MTQHKKPAPKKKKTTAIPPTIGRVVWFYCDVGNFKGQKPPFTALICHVHSDELVNLAAFDNNGTCHSMTSVKLVQHDDEKPKGHYCAWMPYQLGQAAKTEAVTAEKAQHEEEVAREEAAKQAEGPAEGEEDTETEKPVED